MTDKNWKRNERDFATWASEWVGVPIRRNSSAKDCDDRTKNSDVDIEHKKVAIKGTKGITAELAYRKNGLASLYKWLGKRTDKHTIVIVNSKYILLYLETLPSLWNIIKKKIYIELLEYNIRQVESKQTSLVDKKFAQSERYGTTKNLVPILVLREHNKSQLVIIGIATFN
jgi:hypothetical protein